jgi:hypothetical protein
MSTYLDKPPTRCRWSACDSQAMWHLEPQQQALLQALLQVLLQALLRVLRREDSRPPACKASLLACRRPHTQTQACVSIRQHTSAYVRIRQLAPACASMRQHTPAYASIRQHSPKCISIRQHTSAYARIRQHAAACGSICQHAAAYVSIPARVPTAHAKTGMPHTPHLSIR